ncbi:hypothetical protein FWH09_02050, partial [Candidatus Saccharibacteria bacterium]|nr:hypothetical protein [Candidatus Saccharibacteria bacterium]
PFLSRAGDAWFIVKTLSKSNGRVEYESLTIPLTTFGDRLRQLDGEGRIEEFIRLPAREWDR